jgi:octaheme c-type cytochrome (tetrathionate reductase family)
MRKLGQLWIVVILLLFGGLAAYLYSGRPAEVSSVPPPVQFVKRARPHLDHASFFNTPFARPQDVTSACLGCHRESASEVMETAHWEWLGPEEQVPGHAEPMRIGKKNLINNFCISIEGNWASCTQCHAGYGWKDAGFDFHNQENVDCLICHDGSDSYIKGPAGMPGPKVDLLAVAKSVGTPRRQNCGTCHEYGGGGLGVKHGDLDNSLDNPNAQDDVHMGKYSFQCVDCHRTEKHNIRGRAFSVSVSDKNGIGCEDCHTRPPHADERLNRHVASVACATCHIPEYARSVPTKTEWDWSKAGDPNRPEDQHKYLKIKGEFVYANNIVPDYRWFNLSVDRYLLGDKIDDKSVTDINRPRGEIRDPNAKIWPFKIHMATQPYDPVNKELMPLLTAGEGGFWHEFQWDKAVRLGAQVAGLPYSGQYGFTRTRMFWPLSHQVVPKEQALGCQDCHGENSRMNWQALGYEQDPIETGGRQ